MPPACSIWSARGAHELPRGVERKSGAAAKIVVASLRFAQAEELQAVRGGNAHGFVGHVISDEGAIGGPACRFGRGGRLLQDEACGARRRPGESDIAAGEKNGENHTADVCPGGGAVLPSSRTPVRLEKEEPQMEETWVPS